VTQKLKNKIDEEKRAFNSKWEEAYLCAEQGDKPECLICLQVIGVLKAHNGIRHYNTLQKEKYDKYEGATRLAMLYDLISKLSKQKSLFLKSATNGIENLTASNEVCLELVTHKKSFRDREFIKRCVIRIANAFSYSKITEKFKTVSLSHQTVSRRVSKMVDNVSDTLRCVMN
jgi:hypothetical protein